MFGFSDYFACGLIWGQSILMSNYGDILRLLMQTAKTLFPEGQGSHVIWCMMHRMLELLICEKTLDLMLRLWKQLCNKLDLPDTSHYCFKQYSAVLPSHLSEQFGLYVFQLEGVSLNLSSHNQSWYGEVQSLLLVNIGQIESVLINR